MPIKKRSSFPDPTTHVTEHTHEEDVKGGRHPMLNGQYLTVYQFIQSNPDCTREDVARGTGIPSSTATARVKELIDEGFLLEPAGKRKLNRSGIRAKCLRVSERAQGGKPLDRVRVNLALKVDSEGNYFAEANVAGGLPHPIGPVVTIKRTRITVIAPHPDSYRSMVDEAEVSNVSRHELQEHADDIIDADYEVIDNP